MKPSELDVSRETLTKLEEFAALASKWTQKINLVSKATVPELWNRHILDSAQMFSLADAPRHWVDLGSGGGFPGMVVAILAQERCPDTRFTFVESDARKCVFLKEAVRMSGVRAEVLNARIESIDPLGGDVLSARALASLDKLCGFAVRHRAPDGIALFPKGASYKDEIAEAGRNWCLDYEVRPSKIDANSVILKVGKIRHV